jgi:hypothetical protein
VGPRRDRSRSSGKRAGKAVRERIRQQQKAVLRAYLWRIIVVEVAFALLLVVVMNVPGGDFQRGVVLGAVLVVAAGVPFYVIGLNGLMQRGMGAEAEAWTSEELRKLDARQWFVIDDLFFEHSNVDHVLVGPGHVFAVESKWRSFGVSADPMLDRWVEQADWGAGRIERLLWSKGVRRNVTPVVLIWGPKQSVKGAHFVKHGPALVATARGLDELFAELRRRAPRFELDHAACRVLEEFGVGQDDWRARRASA